MIFPARENVYGAALRGKCQSRLCQVSRRVKLLGFENLAPRRFILLRQLSRRAESGDDEYRYEADMTVLSA